MSYIFILDFFQLHIAGVSLNRKGLYKRLFNTTFPWVMKLIKEIEEFRIGRDIDVTPGFVFYWQRCKNFDYYWRYTDDVNVARSGKLVE